MNLVYVAGARYALLDDNIELGTYSTTPKGKPHGSNRNVVYNQGTRVPINRLERE